MSPNVPPINIKATLAGLSMNLGVSLTKPLERQARHIADEFTRLKADRLGPDSEETALAAMDHTAVRLGEFLSTLQSVMESSVLVEEAKLAETTLREIRTLWDGDHFFSEPLRQFFEELALLSPDIEQFGELLFSNLRAYRGRRDAEERLFLAPFYEYRDQLLAIVDRVGGRDSFTHFQMEGRIKRALLSKLETRKWQDMQAFYDLVGLRILVGSQREVGAAVALLEGAFKVHEAMAMIDPEVRYIFQIDNVKPWNNERGYRARHLQVRRFNTSDGSNYATAEIQVMSRGIRDWGEIQRLLVYKEDRIPEAVRPAISDYCRAAADCIIASENGSAVDRLPDFDVTLLTGIPDEALRSNVLNRLCDMKSLVKKYRALVTGSKKQGETL